jgi:sialate O-acetylesterase
MNGGIISGDQIGIYYDNDVALLSLDLSGDWKFSIFREPGVNEKRFNDHKWSTINVPSFWENQGYSNHDGYAWYRKEFSVPAGMNKNDLFITLGRIDDTDKVYLNGKLIGRTEDLMAYDRYSKWNAYRMYRIYPIPEGLLETKNVLVVEVYDGQLQGGIYEGPIGLVSRKNAYILEDRNEDDNMSFPIRAIFKSLFNW